MTGAIVTYDKAAPPKSPSHSRNGTRYPHLDLPTETNKLLGLLGSNQVEPVAYDTAWVARLGDIDRELSSQALDWLRANQLPDGGWGALMPLYHHERVISTLAAVIALVRNNDPEDRTRIKHALPALQHSLNNLDKDVAGRTIAFEMLLPSLVTEARWLGLKIDDPHDLVCKMAKMRDAKIAHAPHGVINRFMTMGFSAEMVGADGVHLLDLDNLQQEDGSVSVSPAATAFFVSQVCPDPAALQYLRRVVQHGGAPAITAIDLFERAWGLWNFTRGRGMDPVTAAHSDVLLDSLVSNWDRKLGIAHATIFSVHDGDDTGLVYQLLAQFDRAPDLAALEYYEEDTHFRCFDLESHISISTNIHMLGALRQAGFNQLHPSIRKIAALLSSETKNRRFWVDKWHASPYYPTAHAIIVCAGYLDELVWDAVNWLLTTQNPDGSWGYYLSTAEETAYSLQALLTWHQRGLYVPKQVLVRGCAWLAKHAKPPYQPLWIGKCLYCPTLVVQSVILGVLQQYQDEFGDLPE